MRDYTVTFDEPVSLEFLSKAASEVFTMPREQIEVWGELVYFSAAK
ncbi:hypothetical protein [Haloglycomyces albus]|nr:hypothetical protein [Haloglycomyces albus]